MKSIIVITLAAFTVLLEVSSVQSYVTGCGTGVPMIVEKSDSDLPMAMMMLMAMNNPRPCACGNNCGCGKCCNPGPVPIPLPIPIPINSPTYVRPPCYGRYNPLPRPPVAAAPGNSSTDGLLNLVLNLLNNANVDLL